MAASNVAGLEGVSVQKSDKIVRINRVMETHKMKPGDPSPCNWKAPRTPPGWKST